jgi:hypothetical protein
MNNINELNLVGKDDLTKLKNLGKFLGVEIVQINIPKNFSEKINSLFNTTKDCINKFSETICDAVGDKNIKINISTLAKIKNDKNHERSVLFFVGLPNWAIVLIYELSIKFKCSSEDLILTILIERILTK